MDSNPKLIKRNRIWLLALLGVGLLGTGGGVGYWFGVSKTAAPLSSPSAQPAPADDIHPHQPKLKNPDGSWRYTNRLAGETSPYLLLHAHNPVDWYPWGPEALERAKQEGKPIFLSVGYSTCYWCHVMERLVFSDPEIAKQMNRWFINIKVDREERPDLDQIYMTATHLINGSGGWPNSVFLTPSLKPFFAGTYFPPEDKFGRPGFPRVLQALHTAWQGERDEVEKQAEQIAEAIRRIQEGRRSSIDSTALDRTLIDGAVQALKDRYDTTYGGFSRAPKFPPDHALALLMADHGRSGVPERLEMVTHTLEMMARGGMYDHLGGGFHRYATDERWWVPHFEKMLYNQAQLAKAYLLAYRTTHQDRFRRTAEEIFRYVNRTMTSPEGGFYSALDSETHGKEGDYYLWTEGEIREILGGDADLFLDVYGLASMPEGEGKVLYLPRPVQIAAADLGIAPEELQARLAPLKGALLRVRQQRERPLLDTKIVTSWNGLMIDAYAYGYEVLKEDTYLKEARRAAEFILNRMRDPKGNLFRTYREGQRKYQGYQEDYAFLIRGLLGLYRASGEDRDLRQAEALTDRMVRLFRDAETGGFYFTSGSENLIARTKNLHDSAIPSGNAVAAHVLLTLYEITGRQDYFRLARRTMQAFAQPAKENPGAYYHMIQAVHRYLDTNPEDRFPASPPSEAPPSAPLPDGADLVRAEASLSPDRPVPGEPFEVSVTLHVTDGWHINAHPASLEILIPTTLSVTSDLPVEVLSVDYPPARKLDLGFAEQPLAVYEGDVTIRATLKLAREGYPKTGGQLRLRLDYQACDDSRCLAPASILLPVEIGPIQQSVGSEG